MTHSGINYWENKKTDPTFLSYLRESSHARNFGRTVIKDLLATGEVHSLLEIGVGGLNEYLVLKDLYAMTPDFRFIGTDWTAHFIEVARAKFPQVQWETLDITQCEIKESLRSDLVYSQHVLEHCPGLNPPLSNMLRLTNRVLINIFFIPPAQTEVINHDMYPLYHNTYSIQHITRVCEHHGFVANFRSFSNQDLPGANECQNEVVLVAARRETQK